MKDVRILVTGGTIDQIRDLETKDEYFLENNNSHIPKILELGRCYHPIIEVLMLIDSQFMTLGDRERLAKAILDAPEDSLVVTHGTITLAETAQFLQSYMLKKTVVLTGAIVPFSSGGSDSEFNLGGAIIASQTLSPGVYGVMNGKVFEAQDIRKNTVLERFDV